MSPLQENAHFSICESLIAAIELMKCNMRRPSEEAEEEGDSDSEIQQLKQKIRLRRQQIRRSRLQPPTAASHHGETIYFICPLTMSNIHESKKRFCYFCEHCKHLCLCLCLLCQRAYIFLNTYLIFIFYN